MSFKELIRPFYLKWVYFPLRGHKPAEWTACWDYPLQSAVLPASSGAPDVLFLPMTDWHVRIQRAQHLARSLAHHGRRCFYLNPHLGREFPYPVRTGTAGKICILENNIFELHAGLPREPVFHHRLLDTSESRALAAALHHMIPPGPLSIISQFPLWNETVVELAKLRPVKLLYDCHDLLSGFSRISPEILTAENVLYRQADCVVFTARSLLENKLTEMPWLGEKAHLVRNGVDVNHFPVSAGAVRKVVGYAGSLDEWFDVEAVRSSAQRFPDCEFVLLGRIEDRKVLALESLPNVRFYGEIPYDRLPVYLKDFTVGLIPFLVTPLTIATNPIKLYEYFSCGIPVVATALPEVEQYGELVYVAKAGRSFSDQLDAALHESGETLRHQRRTVAESQSWDARAKELLQLLAALES